MIKRLQRKRQSLTRNSEGIYSKDERSVKSSETSIKNGKRIKRKFKKSWLHLFLLIDHFFWTIKKCQEDKQNSQINLKSLDLPPLRKEMVRSLRVELMALIIPLKATEGMLHWKHLSFWVSLMDQCLISKER